MNTYVGSWEVDCPSLMEPVVDECSTCPPMPCPMPYIPNTENCRLNSYTDNVDVKLDVHVMNVEY